MNFKDNKGITLIDIVLTIALIGIVLPIYSAIFIGGIQSYNSSQKFSTQQSTVSLTVLKFRDEFERSRTIKFKRDATNPYEVSYIQMEFDNTISSYMVKNTNSLPNFIRTWKFENEKVLLGGGDAGIITEYATGFDTSTTDKSILEIYNTTGIDPYLVFKIHTIDTNTTINTNRNIRKPIAIKFPLLNKNIEEIP